MHHLASSDLIFLFATELTHHNHPWTYQNQHSAVGITFFSIYLQTVLFFQGDLSAVKELLDRGDNPNVRDNAGWTPLVRLFSSFFSHYS